MSSGRIPKNAPNAARLFRPGATGPSTVSYTHLDVYKRQELLTRLDPSLIGGFVIQLGDMTYDKSVRGMLRGLQRSLKER